MDHEIKAANEADDAGLREITGVSMTILEQLRKAISEYRGPLPAVGDSIEEVWLRGAFKQLLDLERQVAK